MTQQIAADAAKLGMGTDSLVPGCSIPLSDCLDIPLPALPAPHPYSWSQKQGDSSGGVKMIDLVYCLLPDVMIKHRTAPQIFMDNPDNFWIPYYPFPHFSTLLFKVFVAPCFFHSRIPNKLPNTIAFSVLVPVLQYPYPNLVFLIP